MTVIKSLSDISFDEIYNAFSLAFKDYERTWNKVEFKNMLARRSFVPELSFGAFDGKELVSFTLNGVGIYNDKRTAYDTGTGTIEAFRGQGLASEIFRYSIPFLQQEGMEQYLLEVLVQNTPAASIYSQLGFLTVRELNYYVAQKETCNFVFKEIPKDIQIREMDLNEKNTLESMWDFSPAWQNNLTAISKAITPFKSLGAFRGDELLGYGIIETSTGDIPQLAVAKHERRKGIGSALLNELLTFNQADTLRIINTDNNCETLSLFLDKKGLVKSGMQYEMIKEL